VGGGVRGCGGTLIQRGRNIKPLDAPGSSPKIIDRRVMRSEVLTWG